MAKLRIEIYENIFIGNFIYILGVQIGMALSHDKIPLPACVNLLQQTPADKYLGDMLASFPGVSFLIEFEYYGLAEPRFRCGVSRLSGTVEPLQCAI